MEIFISILALFATFIIASAAWIQTHNSVRPFLCSIMTSENGAEQIDVVLQNTGLGPAIVTDYYVEHKGRKYRDNEIFSLFPDHFTNVVMHALRPKGAIQAGKEMTILTVPANQANGTEDDIQKKLFENFVLVVKYKSFLGYGRSLFGKDLSFLGREETYRSSDHVWDSITS